MYTAKTPGIARWLVRDAIWRMPGAGDVLYLTFDDGPTPGITSWTLDLLKQYKAKATFFLIGKNAEQHPELVQRMVTEGHTVGNHTMTHVNAWKVDAATYSADVDSARDLFSQLPCGDLVYFRPPYGKLTYRLYHQLRKTNRIALWDVLSGDFDLTLSEQQVWENVRDNAGPGSLIVFHDSVKCESRMKYALERTLSTFSQRGFSFAALPGLTSN